MSPGTPTVRTGRCPSGHRATRFSCPAFYGRRTHRPGGKSTSSPRTNSPPNFVGRYAPDRSYRSPYARFFREVDERSAAGGVWLVLSELTAPPFEFGRG